MRQKLLSSLLGLFALLWFSTVNGQSISIVSHPDTIYYSASVPLVDIHLNVVNISSHGVGIKVKRNIIQTADGSSNYFCWEQCYTSAVGVSPTSLIANPGDTIHNFFGYYNANDTHGVAEIQYCFFNANDTTDQTCVNVFYAEDASSGLRELKAHSTLSNPLPNPASSQTTIHYSLPTGNQGKLVLYNLLGSKVRELPLHQQGSTTIDLSNIPAGVYMYSLVIDGQNIQTKKLLVTR